MAMAFDFNGTGKISAQRLEQFCAEMKENLRAGRLKGGFAPFRGR
ncbi:hypothetical protein [Pararhizobium polonicum]|nr:hypothetical protein [Pararhizobium polonicum]